LSYEFVSRLKRVPILGDLAFSIMDYFQKILTYYPKRDLSRPIFSLKTIYTFVKKGWGRDLIERLRKNPLPIVTTFSLRLLWPRNLNTKTRFIA
jgi:hypothetical protein